MLEGNPWFILRDVLIALGYNLSPRTQTPNVSVAARMLASDEAQSYRIQVKVGSRSGAREVVLISESGFNKLVMRPDKPEAKRFEDWVTSEVLPSIRKTGTYTMPGALV
ncbi:Bro-N domain-containing protein [Cereibacter sphaeroides]|uniref:BRO-N domain-containing protein n=1 Tax=Cereibacter sphaeroides TaxID=1063 RepID=UPI001F1E12C4|nr:BRO family protein [Cereibacter sphaeroides]